MSKVGLMALCLALAMVVVADVNCTRCGQGISEKLAEKAMEGAVNKATGGKANIDLGGNVDLSGLPALLRYPGATAKSRWSVSGEQGSGTVYAFETVDPPATVVNFYKQALSGWKSSSVAETGETTILVYTSDNEKEFVTVNVTKDSDSNRTLLTLLYTKQD